MNKGLFKNIDNFVEGHRFIPMIIIVFILLLINLVPSFVESSKKGSNDYLKSNILYAINLNPSILEFDSENKAILKMDTLYKGIESDNENYAISPIYNEEFDQCAGYVIVTKVNDSFDIDISHMCDMLDY